MAAYVQCHHRSDDRVLQPSLRGLSVSRKGRSLSCQSMAERAIGPDDAFPSTTSCWSAPSIVIGVFIYTVCVAQVQHFGLAGLARADRHPGGCSDDRVNMPSTWFRPACAKPLRAMRRAGRWCCRSCCCVRRASSLASCSPWRVSVANRAAAFHCAEQPIHQLRSPTG